MKIKTAPASRRKKLPPRIARSRLPIDNFFRSLAQDRQERGVGVILSGMGTDGTLGAQAIKEKAGLVLVQEPDTAGFAGMPRSAIDAGLADIVALAEDLPGKIMAYFQCTPRETVADAALLDDSAQGALAQVVSLLRTRTGHDFKMYKPNTLGRRIARRMGIHQIATLFLDKTLHVRRFTPRAATIIKLIASDVGRPITDLVADIQYPVLADDAREVLRTLAAKEKPVAAHDGRWFNVRLMPYRTLDDRIDGVVITFVDITAVKQLDAPAQERHV